MWKALPCCGRSTYYVTSHIICGIIIRNSGLSTYDVDANFKMNGFCTEMRTCNLRCVDEKIGNRKLVAERYRSHLERVEAISLNLVQEGTDLLNVCRCLDGEWGLDMWDNVGV